MDYRGTVIEESLNDKSVISQLKIVSQEVEPVTERHKTPWIKQWTLDLVDVPESDADAIAEKLSKSLDKEYAWYTDYKNDKYHYIIYRDKVFKIDRENPFLYKEAKQYGISLNIPEYQVDFAPESKIWER